MLHRIFRQTLGVSGKVRRYSAEKFDHLLPTFTLEENHKILQALNSKSAEELTDYVSQTRAAKLQAYRKQYGQIKRLDEIFLIEGFTRKTVEKFFNNLLTPQNAAKSKTDSRFRIATFVTPTVPPDRLSQIRNTVSVRVGVTNVSWSRLELPDNAQDACILTHWQQYDVLNKKMHLLELVERCAQVQKHIPMGDCYVLENPQMAQASNNPGNTDQQNINIQRAQIIAILSYVLAARDTPVYYLRRFLASRLFSTLIGTERVSSEDVVLQLLRDYDNNNDLEAPKKGNVHFDVELRQLFANAGRTQREFLGQALLLNLAFVRLVLMQDVKSIAAVTRGNNSKSKIETSDDT